MIGSGVDAALVTSCACVVDAMSSPASAPSLEIGSHRDLENTNLLNWPYLQVEETQATITWRLDPSTFARSLNRQNQFVVPTAKLPNVLPIAIRFDVEALPFAGRNFA